MKQQREQIKLIAHAAKDAGFSVTKLGSIGETMLGNVIQVSDGNKFWLISTNKIGFFPNTSAWFKMLCNSKETSCKLLKKLGYNSIPSVSFSASQYSNPDYYKKICNQIKKFPVVCKPENGLRGRGIKVATDQTQLEEYCLKAKKKDMSFLVQPIVTGNEYRVAVFEDRVFFVHNKNFYAITGNGTDSIGALCNKRKNPVDKDYMSYLLKKLNYTRGTILPDGEKIPVKVIKNDGNEIFTEDEIPKPIKNWALKLCKDLGCSTVGIDLIIPDDITEVSKYKIFEINASPAFSYIEPHYRCKDLVDKIAAHIVAKSFK